jgi:hypothetical protein
LKPPAGVKRKKIIFLTLALVLPVGIFVFLKIFGRNEFQVPVMYENEKVEAPENCNFPYTIPYRIPDSVLRTVARNAGDSLFVFYFDPAVNTAMKRVSVEFDSALVEVIHPAEIRKKTDVTVLQQCVLLMKPGVSVALVDHNNRIRGYYNGADRDEVDRLIVEIKIILREY